jgi:hypothetical protein
MSRMAVHIIVMTMMVLTLLTMMRLIFLVREVQQRDNYNSNLTPIEEEIVPVHFLSVEICTSATTFLVCINVAKNST